MKVKKPKIEDYVNDIVRSFGVCAVMFGADYKSKEFKEECELVRKQIKLSIMLLSKK